jgi:hypothetical protein
MDLVGTMGIITMITQLIMLGAGTIIMAAHIIGVEIITGIAAVTMVVTMVVTVAGITAVAMVDTTNRPDMPLNLIGRQFLFFHEFKKLIDFFMKLSNFQFCF